MITYHEENLRSVIAEAKPLLMKHWEEIANHKDTRPLNPDFEKYFLLNDQGIIRIFTVRYQGQLVGYASFVISENLHYKDWKYASCDIYYLAPELRKIGIGTEMFTKIEEWLKTVGVISVIVHEKTNHLHSELFKSLDYKHTENIYEKVL